MTKSLRHDILASSIALIALICQLFFGLVHTTTVWVAAAGPVAQVEKGSVAESFLQICSAGGLVTLDGEEDSSGQFDASQCQVCSSAVAAPLLDSTPPIAVVLDRPAEILTAQLDAQTVEQRMELTLFVRGPPLFS